MRLRFNKKIIFIILSYSSYSNAFIAKSIDPLSDPVTMTVNADICKISNESDLGVCLMNKTGNDLNFNNIFLQETFSGLKGGYSGETIIDYKILKQGKFLILESTRNRVSNGDERNHIPYDYVEYFLRIPFDGILIGCEFKWDPLIPPYAQPAILVIKNTAKGYQCSYASKNKLSRR